MSDPFADLLGDSEPVSPPKNRGGRPTNAEKAARELQHRVNLASAASGRALEDVGGVQALRRPVTINTLATVYGHDVQTITRRLIDCPFQQHGNRKLYDFKEATSFIIKPRMTPEQFVKTLNSSHLPPEINKAFWDGQRSRVKYKIESQEAWLTEEVNAALGALCMTVKEALSTITEDMRDRARLSDEQAVLFDAAIDDLRTRLAEKLEELAARTDDTSMYGKALFGAGGALPPDSVETDEWGDEE